MKSKTMTGLSLPESQSRDSQTPSIPVITELITQLANGNGNFMMRWCLQYAHSQSPEDAGFP